MAEDLTTAALQDIAQIVSGASGVVYHVKASGGSDGNGLSWDDAYLHTTTSAKTVIEAASANDVVVLGPGTFALGANAIEVPAGVTVKGAGMDITILTSTIVSTEGGSPIYVPGDNTLTEDLTITGISGDEQMAVGTNSFRSTQAFVGAVLRHVKAYANQDAFYVNHTEQVSATLIDCEWRSEYDGVVFRNGAANSWFVLVNNRIICEGTDEGNPSRAIWCEEANITIWAYNIDIYSTSAGPGGNGVACDDGVIVLHGGTVHNTSTGSPPYSRALSQTGGTLIAIGVNYDRSQTFGTVIEESSAESALIANNLDHLAKTATGAADMTSEVADNTVLSRMLANGDTSGFVPSTDGLQLIRDAILTAAQIWANATRTLTQSAQVIVSQVSGSDITIHRGDTASLSLTGLGSIADRSKLWFSVKERWDDPADTAALLQVTEAVGLVRINGAEADTAANASIVVDDEDAGDITITVKPVETAKLVPHDERVYDVQVLRTGGEVDTLSNGTFAIDEDVSRVTA